jgi:flagellar protein FliT
VSVSATSERIISRWEAALALTRRMLETARRSDWEALVQLERERDQLIEEIRREDVEPLRSAAQRGRRRDVLQAMLALDEEIRALTEDWMRELREILASVNTSQRLNKTYSQP